MTTIGMLGAGGIAESHLSGWISLGFDVVVYSIDDGAPALTARFGGRPVGSREEVLALADIVDVVTPTSTHRELVEAAAAAGKHVVCEKPLALTVADAEAMLDACERAGVQLFPAHVVRYFPAYAAMQASVASGALGSVAVQRFFRIGASPKRAWFRDPALSGGIAMDQMVHDFDQARWSAGEVESVYATLAGDQRAGAATVQAILRHASGALTHVNGVWGHPSLNFHTGYTVAGTGGMLEHDSREHPVLSYDGVPSTGESGYLPPVDPAGSPYTAELADFARVVREGGAARVSARDGVEAVRIAAAVNLSLARNERIAVEEVR